MLCTKYFVLNYFVCVDCMLNNNMGYLVRFKLVQQCMKQLGGLYMWNVLYENGSCGFYFITYNLNRYIFRNINTIGFLFLTQHTTPLLYVEIHFGVIHVRGTGATRSDTP